MTINPEELLSQSYDAANSTQLIPFPAGEFQAVIDDVGIRTFEYKKGDRAGQTGYILDVTWEATDPSIAEELGRAAKVRQSVFLDFENGALDMSEGKNVTLGRLREATGLNEAGRAFSFINLKGRTAVIQVTQDIDGDNIRSQVNRVTAA